MTRLELPPARHAQAEGWRPAEMAGEWRKRCEGHGCVHPIHRQGLFDLAPAIHRRVILDPERDENQRWQDRFQSWRAAGGGR